MSIAKLSLKFTGLFEAELLVELMLRYWKHPWAADKDYRSALLETAAEALRGAIAGEELILGLPPKAMSLVAAIWYVESNSLDRGDDECTPAIRRSRQRWLDAVRRAVPSCFCDPGRLGE